MKRRYWLVMIAVLALLVVSAPWAAAAPPYFLKGDFNAWGISDPMIETYPGSHIYTAPYMFGEAGRHEWKASDEGWSEYWPGSGNSWMYATGGNQANNFYLDQNSYDDGWWPQTNIVSTDATPPTAWTAVGDWQGWDIGNAATAMTDVGGGIYSLVYDIAVPATYQYKAVNTGSWDAVGADGIGVNANTLLFTTTVPSQPVRFKVNPAAGRIRVDVLDELVINELDADQVSTDAAEFIELYDGGQGNMPLDGLVLVLFNGNGDVSYGAYDLDGYTTSASGYFVFCGDAANVPNCDLDVTPNTNLIQNGADAAAVYFGDAADFPSSTPVTNTNLIDAIVYDTSDADDAGLLDVLLNPGQPQVNENSAGNGTEVSNQRCPNGSGGQRNTDTYVQMPPTPGLQNDCRPDLTVEKVGPALALPGGTVMYTITYANSGTDSAENVVLSDTLPSGLSYVSDDSTLSCSACSVGATGTITWSVGTMAPGDDFDFTLTGLVSSTVSTGTSLVNRVTITTTDDELTVANNGDEWPVSINALDLSVAKTGPEAVFSGKDVVYTIIVQTQGVVAADNVVVTDTLPVSVTYVSDDSGWAAHTSIVGAHEVVTWSPGSVPADTTYTFNLTGTVDADVAQGTLTNVVSATTTTADDPIENNSAEWPATAYPLVPIKTAREGANGEVFGIEGQVTYLPPTYNGTSWGLQDGTGGITIYYYPPTPVQLGDHVRLVATRGSYSGEEEMIAPVSFYANLGPGPEVVPLPYSTGDVDQGLSEGWLVEVSGTAANVGTCSSFNYTFQVDDGTGEVDIYVDGTTGIDVCAMGFRDGDFVRIVGFSTEYNGTYQIKPRSEDDVWRQPTGFIVSKSAPANVLPGAAFTYTLEARNDTGATTTGIVMTDALPADVTIAGISDGGVDQGGNVVRWDVASLAAGVSVTRTVTVTAPETAAVLLVNEDYYASASEWTTPTTGSPVYTLVNTEGGVVPIHVIQGSGSASPLVDQSGIVIDGVVVGDFQGSSGLRGFFVQEEDTDADADPLTSEGIFVYDGSSPGVDVSVGDQVRVEGTVSEYYGLTELGSSSVITEGISAAVVTPASITLPLAAVDDLEAFEGMAVSLTQELHATEVYNLGHYGQVMLTDDGRLFNPTQVVAPGAAAQALQDENNLRVLLLDDGVSASYPLPVPYLGDQGTLRLGDTLGGLSGALTMCGSSYCVEPTSTVTFNRENPRTAAPEDTSGSIAVASFNVLNYFTTIDTGAWICGPSGDMECRGADSALELERQRAKIVSALAAIDADVVGLMEIENNATSAAAADLVTGLNDLLGAGTYDYINTGYIGTDAIQQALIYKPATVTPVGAYAILDTSVDPNFIDTANRPVLAQTFEIVANGDQFTVAVNHLKSKGSDCNDLGDPDTGDGQGNCNLTRKAAAIAEVNWLAGHPTGSLDPDALIIGDLNSYAMEDPMTAIKDAGYTDLQAEFVGPDAYTYVYNGQFGSLDQALSNSSLTPKVASTTIWHINSDEPPVLDYNTEHKDAPDYLPYSPDAYRASDHDPIVVRLSVPDLALSKDVSPSADVELGGSVVYTITLENTGLDLAVGVLMTDELPAGVTFGGWVEQNGAIESGGTLTWSGDVAAGSEVEFVFTATVGTDPSLYSETITNTASFTSDNAGSGSKDAVFTIVAAPLLPDLTVTKDVTPTQNLALGDVVTYTIALHNSGAGQATEVALTDELPAGVAFGGWVAQNGASEADGTLTWTGDVPAGSDAEFVFTATVGTDPSLYGQTITNIASFTSDNAGSGADDAALEVGPKWFVYMPLVFKND
jgi:uncharacterized repeat protein (TIGR01451 family)